jgi:DNA helicase-2/ATP-dependent DNA helicase PcrA
MDFCGLQGDDDGEQAGPRKPRVAFLTMHASKGKEFGCVVAMSFYEGGLPSAQALSAMEMEQERNLAYVAVTRAKDQLLITWPKEFLARTQTGFLRSMSTQESSFLKDALFAARQRKLPGVQYKEADV